jgi:alpha-tubulin suppressor-like RCC1 family protein
VPSNTQSYALDEIIVVFNGAANDKTEILRNGINEIASITEGAAVEVFSTLRNGNALALVSLPTVVSVEDALLVAANNPDVLLAYPNYYGTYDADTTINDPYGSWQLSTISALDAWDLKKTDGAVTIAILDTGTNMDHPDLSSNILYNEAYDAVHEQPLAQSVAEGNIGNGGDSGIHGTFVAGLAAAEANNAIGIAGTSYNANILPVSMGPSASITHAIQGCDEILRLSNVHPELNIRVVNMSFSFNLGNSAGQIFAQNPELFPMYDKIVELNEAGILVVAAAGNDGYDQQYFAPGTAHNYFMSPSDFPEVLSVTSIDSNNVVAYTSSHNEFKNIAAPGVSVWSSYAEAPTSTVQMSGTSCAAPMVSGIAALLFAADTTLTPAEVKAILESTATDLGETGFDYYYGWGKINALAAVQATIDQVYTAAAVIEIAAADHYCLALKDDGTVWAWGDNRFGQLGDGTLTDRYNPVQVSALFDMTAIAAASHCSVGLKADGTVWTWGSNANGMLGNGTLSNYAISDPTQVSGLTNMTTITASINHAAAIKDDGTVWAWGLNNKGQLGDGTQTNRHTPVQVIGLTDVVAVAVGDDYSIALKSNGTVWGWGCNELGQLGCGGIYNQAAPVQVYDLFSVVSISAGYSYAAALRADGSVWSWGDNSAGQIGDGTTTTRRIPVRSSIYNDVIKIEVGDYHTCVIRADGTVWAWGLNTLGTLGDGTAINKSAPVQMLGVTDAVSISASFFQTIVLTGSNEIMACGYNMCGALGNGNNISSLVPISVIWIQGQTLESIDGQSQLSSVYEALNKGTAVANRYDSSIIVPALKARQESCYHVSDGSILRIEYDIESTGFVRRNP